MPSFLTRVYHPDGVRTQRVEAPDAQAVAGVLGVLPQHVLAVTELGAAGLAGPGTQAGAQGLRRPRLFSGQGSKRFPLQLFSQELAVLLDAGIALLEALNTLREKESHETCLLYTSPSPRD